MSGATAVPPKNSTRTHLKFTKGEKCIFAHLIVIFVLLIVLLSIYFIHLWLVKHNGSQAFTTYLRSSDINPGMNMNRSYYSALPYKRIGEVQNQQSYYQVENVKSTFSPVKGDRDETYACDGLYSVLPNKNVHASPLDYPQPIAFLEDIRPEYHPVGLVYADTNNFMCNCLLIRYRWSLAPGHCVAARSDPDLADFLPSWKIKYRTRSYSIAANYSETTIKRSIAHPHFNSDDFSNNIGLFQHDNAIPIFSYMFPNQFTLSESSLKAFKDNLELIGWEESWQPPNGHVLETSVRPVTLEKCSQYVSPIVDLRNYEYCVKPAVRRNATIVPGAVLSMNSKFMGLFSWGETSGSATPFIIIDIVNFKDWIEHVVAI